jgi:hypothetical protein
MPTALPTSEKALLRKAVSGFSVRMLRNLFRESHKRGWNDSQNQSKFVERLVVHVVRATQCRQPEACIDAANYCMMLYRCLQQKMKRSGVSGYREPTSGKVATKHKTGGFE